MTTKTDKYSDSMTLQEKCILFKSAPVSIAGSLLAAAGSFWVFRQIEREQAGYWLLVLLLLVTLRLLFVYRAYKKHAFEFIDDSDYIGYFVCSAIEGIVWSCALILFFSDDASKEAFILVLTVGISVTSLIIFFPVFKLFMLFVTPILLTVSFTLLTEGSDEYFVLGGLAIVLLVLLMAIARKMRVTFETLIELNAENKILAIQAQEAHKKVTRFNEKLADEVEKKTKELVKSNDDLEERNKEVIKQNEEIESFYQTVSHELKTPLTSIREFISILLDGLPGELNQKQKEYLEVANKSCELMTVYINDLLDVTRIGTNKLQLFYEKTEIETILKKAESIMSPLAKQKRLVLSTKIQDNMPSPIADSKRVVQILINLINNAIKYTEEGGEITISAYCNEQSKNITIAVVDTGCGIPQNELDKIFSRLYQVKKDHPSSAEGLGLGLYISNELVRLHGGYMDVASEVGVGTTFKLILPLDPQNHTKLAGFSS